MRKRDWKNSYIDAFSLRATRDLPSECTIKYTIGIIVLLYLFKFSIKFNSTLYMDFNSLIIILNNALLLQFYKRYRKLVKSIISQIKDKPKHNQGRKMSNTRGLNLGRLTEDYDSNKWAMRTFDSKLFKAKKSRKRVDCL